MPGQLRKLETVFEVVGLQVLGISSVKTETDVLADACSLPLLPFEWLNCVFVLSCQCTAPPRCARWRPPAN